MSNEKYYVPHGTYWPIIGSIGISVLFVGFANQMHDVSWGWPVMVLGFAIIAFMMFGWLGTVVSESVGGLYNAQVDRSFRWGMSWFIFSEVMFFAAFFGALLYARVLSVPWLGGEYNNIYTPELWEGFKSAWPLITTWMLATIALGVVFLGFQITEYGHAYHDGLKLTSGIYGSTFYLLTGFHGFHVTIGVIMLTVILYRIQKGHFNLENHFAFEGVAWYWHFVDVVWLGLFIFVYWI